MFDWSEYREYAKVKSLKKKTILFRQGEKANGFYYLKSGKIIISVLRQDGYERIIDFVFSGSLIGEQMINNTASFTTAKLQVDSVLYYFSVDQFELLCKKHPKAADEFRSSLIQKVRLLANVNTILNAPIAVQLAFFLINLFEKKGDRTIEINQTAIAKYIGKSRVAVWQVLKKWRNDGLIEINNQSLTLLNIKRLKEIAKKIL